MKNNIATIMKKEFSRFFKDRRMVFTTIIMPGLMIYVIYTFMGQGLTSMFAPDQAYVPTIYVQNSPQMVDDLASLGIQANVEKIEAKSVDGLKNDLQEGKENCDLIMIFPEDFDDAVAAYDVASGAKAPEISLYYNSTEPESINIYSIIDAFLAQYETAMANKFDVNSGEAAYDLATEEDTTAQVFSMMIPMLMMVFLFSGCMAIAPESIAGEKERGTIATLLVTPMKRGQLALGKIISLSVIAILSGCSSFIGTMLSMPSIMGDVEGLDAGIYQMSDYALLLAVILSTVLVIISLLSIISAYAKTVKEATTWATPLMLVVMLIGVTSMMDTLSTKGTAWYFIPLYNSVRCMGGIFSRSYMMTNILVTVIANICYTAICAGILTKMFSSEKVMFSK
ncbi:ABC transporter permease [Lachnospiraceae bacterium ZAX-1]